MMEKVENFHNLPDNCDDKSTNSKDSIHTNQFKPFSINIQFNSETKISKIVSKNIDKNKNHRLLIFTVNYISHDEHDHSQPKNLNNTRNTFSWDIYKSFQDIQNLTSLVKLQCMNDNILLKSIDKEVLKNFDIIIDLEKTSKKLEIRVLRTVVQTINGLLLVKRIRDKIFFLEFLEISRHSFDCFNEGKKPKEGYIQKMSWPRSRTSSFFQNICCYKKWRTSWFVVKDDMICDLDNSSSDIGKDIFWFDQELTIQKNDDNIKNSIVLINSARKLVLKFSQAFEREIWYNIIYQKLTDYQSKVKNVYGSFANEKFFCNARWFVDAVGYFEDLHEKLLKATESIYIAGWWVSPELWLIRPVNLKNKKSTTRLMDVLLAKATQNVEINLLIYKEVTFALSVNSDHTKSVFDNLHPNIRVTRHPKKKLDLLWSHHEKIVIIDQKIGYIGGIDLCWGRFDNSEHILTESTLDVTGDRLYLFPGQDYSNSRVKDFENVSNYLNETIDRYMTPRMPWHDIHLYLEGPIVSDLSRHFVERWNFARTSAFNAKTKKKYTIINVKKNARSNTKTHLGVNQPDDINFSNNVSYTYTSPLLNEKFEFPPEEIQTVQDKRNTLSICNEEFKLKRNMIEDVQRRNTFNDVNNYKNLQAKNNNTSNLGNSAHENKTSITGLNNKNPKKANLFIEEIKNRFSIIKDGIKAKKVKLIKLFANLSGNKDLMNIRMNEKQLEMDGNKSCHIIRSASNWSAGLDNVENSIMKAYYNLIDNSKHYILIENQFFISKSFTDEENRMGGSTRSSIINEIALHIRKRIEKAYQEKQKFRVFVFIPLLPGFAGDVTDTITLQIILKYTYRTLSRNRGLSLIEKLYQLMQDRYEDYIYFFSLRQHGVVNGIPNTELIYIHSKLMIVDDECVLIGSANINDRSLLGSRDSEIAVVIREQDKILSKMNNCEFYASSFARSLRIRLMKEHMGFDLDKNDFPEILLDPLDDRLFNMMKDIAKTNTVYYRKIFDCYPDDNLMNFEMINRNIKEKCQQSEEEIQFLIDRYNALKNNIIGNIVDFPLDFLKEENLNRSYFCKEILVPIKNFL